MALLGEFGVLGGFRGFGSFGGFRSWHLASPEAFLLIIVSELVLLAEWRVVVVMGEGAARRVELVRLYHFAPHVPGGSELQSLRRGTGAYLVSPPIGVVVLSLGYVHDDECSEALDGHFPSAFGELVAYLVEDGRKHLLDGSAADAAALDDCGDEVALVITRAGHDEIYDLTIYNLRFRF